jgi:branched-chain amino acid transport system permease protein
MMSLKVKIALVVVALAALVVVVPNTNAFLILLATRVLAFSILVMSRRHPAWLHRPSVARPSRLSRHRRLSDRHSRRRVRVRAGHGFLARLVLGILSGRRLAAVFGLLAIRAAGVYFLMITLALGQCVWGLAYRWNSLTGGDNGINVPDQAASSPASTCLTTSRSSMSSSPSSSLSLLRCTFWCARRSGAALSASASASCA